MKQDSEKMHSDKYQSVYITSLPAIKQGSYGLSKECLTYFDDELRIGRKLRQRQLTIVSLNTALICSTALSLKLLRQKTLEMVYPDKR